MMKKIIVAAVALMALLSAVYAFNNNSGNNTNPFHAVAAADKAQNSMEADFTFVYQMLEARGRNIPVFSSPDSYILEFNRPRIPLYSKEVELPENAALESVEMKDSEMKTFENVEADFVPMDEHFAPANDSLEGFYPEQVFWHNIFETLDGRKKVEIVAAPMQFNNQTMQAKIYGSMKIAVYYRV